MRPMRPLPPLPPLRIRRPPTSPSFRRRIARLVEAARSLPRDNANRFGPHQRTIRATIRMLRAAETTDDWVRAVQFLYLRTGVWLRV